MQCYYSGSIRRDANDNKKCLEHCSRRAAIKSVIVTAVTKSMVGGSEKILKYIYFVTSGFLKKYIYLKENNIYLIKRAAGANFFFQIIVNANFFLQALHVFVNNILRKRRELLMPIYDFDNVKNN